MIKPGEIQKRARLVGVRDQQIEKDYIISWILQGIAQHDQLSRALVFKGGTVLKKVYFDDYRFSEDIDFTALQSEVSKDQFFGWFAEVFQYIREEANIPLEITNDTDFEDGGINFYISYLGPFGGIGANKRVKVDISRSEKLVFEPLRKEVISAYSDQAEHKLLCYSLEEVLVEKLRSVMQRMQARDFYDLWYLLEIKGMDIAFYKNEFMAKCECKGIDPTDFHKRLTQRLPQYRGRWQYSMADQIQDLPDFDRVQRELLRHLKRLELT